MKPSTLNDINYIHNTYIKHLGSQSTWNLEKPNARQDVVDTMQKAFKLYTTTSKIWNELSTIPLDKLFVWSDQHIGHTNIIKACNRHVKDVEEMDFLMLENAKSIVGENDWLLFCGDVAMKNPPHLKEWLKECPGKKVLILGNHDIKKIDQWMDLGFLAVSSCWIKVLTSEEKLLLKNSSLSGVERLWFTHYPLEANLIPPHTINVHGHLHETVLNGAWLNLSVEQQNLSPMKLIDRFNTDKFVIAKKR